MNMNIIKSIPFSYVWILHKSIGEDVKTMLDIGCGNGSWMEVISSGKNWNITGTEIYKQSVLDARERGIYKKVIQTDVTKLPAEILKEKYDIVFSSQVVEHLPKAKAIKLIKQLEKLGNRRIVISTTVGFMHFCPFGHCHEDEENPYQEHKSAWDPDDFRKLGYTTHGQGLFLVYREGYLGGKAPKFILPLLYVIAFLCSPLVYFFPTLGAYQVAYKNFNYEKK